MCCSMSPNVKVHFSDTILYAAEILNPQNKTVHVLGYQNRAQNNVGGFFTFQNGFWNKLKNIFTAVEETNGNAMILPFPAVPRTMSKASILDTEKCPNILKNIASAVTPVEPPAQSFGLSAQSRAPVVEIFEAAGIYTIVLAQDARAIPDVLDQVPKEKRPQLNPELFEAYAKWYPDWTIALCCFNNDDLKEAHPMLWWYEPMNPNELFMPALDCHTGNVPSLHISVQVDHTLGVGSALREKKIKDTSPLECRMCSTKNPADNEICQGCGYSLEGYGANTPNGILNFFAPKEGYQSVYYSDGNSISSEVKPYLVDKVIGGVFHKYMPNGDFVCQIDEVRKGIWNPVRTLPPNADAKPFGQRFL